VTAAHATLVWLADAGGLPESAVAAYAGWLGQDERARHARFVRAERRRQFVAGRALARLVLGRLLGVAPAAMALQERPGQGPALLSPAHSAAFSISHSGPWIAVAASTETLVGLDIERIDPSRDVMGLAQQAFGPEQLVQLAACDALQRIDVFYRMWCEHEARIKLGAPVGSMVDCGRPGLAGALACAAPPAADITPELVDLGRSARPDQLVHQLG
jgi:4'-phosphopantetheinyl transferase